MRPATRRKYQRGERTIRHLLDMIERMGGSLAQTGGPKHVRWANIKACEDAIIEELTRAERRGRCGDCAYNFTPFNKEGGTP